MKAVVLTCDKYHPMANLCIASYEKHWPQHPFEFLLPYQEAPHPCLSERQSNRLTFIRTPKAIVGTMAALLRGIPDDEWVYWCMDDRYVIGMDAVTVMSVYKQVLVLANDVISVRLISSRKEQHSRLGIEKAWVGGLSLVETPGSAGIKYPHPWLHQFVRAGVLRSLFLSFPREPTYPKEMDYFPHLKKAEQRVLEVQRTAMSLGESTSRGKITANALVAFKQYKMPIPEQFEWDLNKRHFEGQIPLRFCGTLLHIPQQWRLRWAGVLLRWFGFRPWRGVKG